MIIGHSAPTAATWTVSGTGAQFLSPQRFGAQRPDMATAVQWLSGTQTTASVLRLRAEWPSEITPGLLYLAGGDLPAGTKIDVAWRRAADPAGTYPYQPAAHNAPQRIVAGPRGERTCGILLQPGALPVVGCEIRIYNDVSGVPSIKASATITLGAVIPCVATEVDIDADWSITTIDPTTVSRSGTQAVYTVPGIPYRELSFAWAADDQTTILDTRAELAAKIDRGQRAVYIPRHRDPAGAFDATMLHRTAMIGTLTKLPGAAHAAGPFFRSAQGTAVESPVPP